MNEQATTEAKQSHRGLRGEGPRIGDFRAGGVKWIATRPTESRDFPSLATLKKLAKALKVTLAELVE